MIRWKETPGALNRPSTGLGGASEQSMRTWWRRVSGRGSLRERVLHQLRAAQREVSGMYRCSECGLLVGPEDAVVIDEPSRPCPSCRAAASKSAAQGGAS
jgi:rubrerythrin